jgi:rubrerythrin
MHWTFDDIPWDRFAPESVDPHILAVVKAAAMVERNAADYAAYLRNVFFDDADFRAATDRWQAEEEQHGDILGHWAEMADPSFDYEAARRRFIDGYRIDIDVSESIRGSRTGELIARCIVETGTSSFYSALRDATDEPVLKTICHKIAGDEFRHYKLFYSTMKTYQKRETVPAWRRFLVAVGRIRESEDDELAFAWHAANQPVTEPYDRARCTLAYGARAFNVYRKPHVERGAHMVMKAAGLTPRGWMGDLFGKALWSYISRRADKLADERKRQAA